jgi:hypothetical protein
MDSLDPLHWGMLGMIALLSVSVLMLAQNHLELEGRVLERELASPTPAELRLAVDESRLAVGESLRAHGRLEAQLLQFPIEPFRRTHAMVGIGRIGRDRGDFQPVEQTIQRGFEIGINGL